MSGSIFPLLGELIDHNISYWVEKHNDSRATKLTLFIFDYFRLESLSLVHSPPETFKFDGDVSTSPVSMFPTLCRFFLSVFDHSKQPHPNDEDEVTHCNSTLMTGESLEMYLSSSMV